MIVNLDDLCNALEQGEIGGAALDVYEIEPLPAEHPCGALRTSSSRRMSRGIPQRSPSGISQCCSTTQAGSCWASPCAT